jgi:hypothetical protein
MRIDVQEKITEIYIILKHDLSLLELGLELMVSPRTAGIRGRGTRLKRTAKRRISGALIAIICALFSVGLTLEGLSFSMLGQRSVNLLSLVGITLGSIAIISAVKLWHEGRKLQSYRIPKKTITQKFVIKVTGKRRKNKDKNKKDMKKSKKKEDKKKKDTKKKDKKKKDKKKSDKKKDKKKK